MEQTFRPWEVLEIDNDIGIAEATGVGRDIAILNWGYNQPDLPSREEALIHAELLAAAPDMLKVCKLIASKMYDDSVGRTVVQAAQEVIAKVEGKNVL